MKCIENYIYHIRFKAKTQKACNRQHVVRVQGDGHLHHVVTRKAIEEKHTYAPELAQTTTPSYA